MDQIESHHIDEIYSRLGENEKITASLVSAVQSIKDVMLQNATATHNSLVEIRNDIRTHANKLSDAGRSDWKVLAAWAGVIIAMGSAAAGVQAYVLNGVSKQVDQNESRYLEHIADGHPASMKLQIEANNKLDDERFRWNAEQHERMQRDFEGRLELLQRQIDAIDLGGPRAWNRETR